MSYGRYKGREGSGHCIIFGRYIKGREESGDSISMEEMRGWPGPRGQGMVYGYMERAGDMMGGRSQGIDNGKRLDESRGMIYGERSGEGSGIGF